MPPAVKGLPDLAFVEFAEGDATSFEFSDYQTVWAWESIARMFGRMRDYLIEKEGSEKADQVISSYNIEEITAAVAKEKAEVTEGNKDNSLTQYKEKEDGNMTFKEKIAAIFGEVVAKIPDETPAGQFSEADLAKVRTEAEAKGKQIATAEFAEQQRQTRLAGRKAEIAAFCETLVAAGKITPATVRFGLPEILFSMVESDNQIEFGETKEKSTTFDRMKALLESATPLVTFGEVASRTKDAGGQGTAGDKIEALIVAKIKDKKELSYSAAFAEVQQENPDLSKAYMAEVQEK